MRPRADVVSPNGRSRLRRSPERHATHHKGWILFSLCLGALIINIDVTIVNVALPTLVRELDATITDLQWVVDAYSLVFASLILAAGSLSGRVGRKGVLLVGLGVFAAGSLAGSLATTPAQLIAARAVMGIGAAGIFPSTLSLLANVFTNRAEKSEGDRSVGRDDRCRDRRGPDHRRMAARAPLVGQRLLVHGAGRRRHRRLRCVRGPDVQGPGRTADRWAWPAAVHRGHGASDLQHHRGAGLGVALVSHARHHGRRNGDGDGGH
jgi:hypothetical protein